MKLAGVVLAGGLAASLLGGCLVTSSNQVQTRGTQVSPATLRQVEPGETTESWLLATLGEPSERTPVPGQSGVEILKYVYSVQDSGSGTVFLVFAGSHDRSRRTTTYFELTDGVVTRFWKEE
jgi:outer membrane protein assembly factor BamE (lipoprotein component of BamABCDE complex)